MPKESKIFLYSKLIFLLSLALGVGMEGFWLGKLTTPVVNDREIVQSMNFSGDCVVIGHLNPDTDTVSSSILAANLYQQAFNANCTPAISGKINNETKFVLETFKLETPEIINNAKNKKVILVDHSTLAQSIENMAEAEIMAIYDHHSLGDVQTKSPLLARISPVGCTATILYTQYLENSLKITKPLAGLMLSAILSDTNNLTSATTTVLDQQAVQALQPLAEISDLDAYYAELQTAAASYDGMSDAEIFGSDYKEYKMSNFTVGIASVNAKNLEDATSLETRMLTIMSQYLAEQKVEYLFIAINNQADNQTTILGLGEDIETIMTQAFGSTKATLTPIASRKKDIVPKLETAFAKRAKTNSLLPTQPS